MATIDLTLADILTAPVKTVRKDWPLDRLATFLIDNHVSGAPVTTASGEVVGVVSMTDIVRHGSVPATAEDTDVAHEYYSGGHTIAEHELHGFQVERDDAVTAGDLMTSMLFDLPESATVQQAADMMVRGGIHRVLVTADRKLVGIVTAHDLLKVIRDL